MAMDIQGLSARYAVRRLTEADLPELLELAEGNTTYYEHLGQRPTLENLREDLTKLPPRTTPEDKYFLGYFREGRLAAVLDLITRYPTPETAFIGWFILRRDLQGRGAGTDIFSELLFRLSYRYLRLGYVKGNRESERFWKKLHFAPTGLEIPGEAYTMVVMELGRGDTHAFGIMDRPPEPGRDYGDYAPERYVCAWAEDDALQEAAEAVSNVDCYWETLDRPSKGLAWYGVTLVPPDSLPALLSALEDRPGLQPVRRLLAQAERAHQFVIHFGI